MSTGQDAISFAKQIALQRLDSHPAWPRTAYRLECEAAGVYQDESGQALKELKNQGKIGRKDIQVRGNQRVYFTRPESPRPDPDDKIQTAVQQFETFLTKSGAFGNLAVYVALCKIHEELSSYITGFDVLPEADRPFLLNNPGRRPDMVVLFPDEKSLSRSTMVVIILERTRESTISSWIYLQTRTGVHQQIQCSSTTAQTTI